MRAESADSVAVLGESDGKSEKKDDGEGTDSSLIIACLSSVFFVGSRVTVVSGVGVDVGDRDSSVCCV